MEILLLPIGLACVFASIAHGYLGQTRLIAPAEFPRGWARGFVSMIWQYSTVTWATIGAFIAVSPWLLTADERRWAIPAACLPILYGVIGNAIVSQGRHFGWMLFAAIIAAASLVALL
ncbi:MAG: hypothetical protein R3E14_00985 [Erythrobacter sp.]